MQPEGALSFAASGGDRPPTPAEEAFASFLDLAERGEQVDFESFCRARPALGAELRRLHGHWVQVQSVLERLGMSRGDGGSRAQPAGGAEREGPWPGAALLERLGRRKRGEDADSRYRSQGEISRGGMGAILRVWDEDLRRSLAMKVVLPQGGGAGSSDRRSLGRFLEEAQITGQLDHPGIVPVHELGLDERGRLFFTMRLVQGDHLGEIFRKTRAGEEGWTRTRVLGVLLRVCEAMAFAHEKGVVHRDLKPANVMVGRFGEAYVMDWGLARVLGREDTKDVRLAGEPVAAEPVSTDRRDSQRGGSPLLTMDGDVIGTPSYMAPEQARGKLAELGPATDVYSVGAILYELLAGRAPYQPGDGRSVAARVIWNLVLAGPPLPLDEIAPDVPAELVAICERAMSREPSERYADMGAMAEDLRAFLENRVVRAYRTGALVELRKWVRRNRGAAAALAALFLVALLAAAVVAWNERRRTEGIRRHSDPALAQGLVRDFEERGPIDPAHVPERERWLERLQDLAGRWSVHEAELAELRARARPLDEVAAARMRDEDPLSENIRAWGGLLGFLDQGVADMRKRLQDPGTTAEQRERLQRDVAPIELERPVLAAEVDGMRAALARVRPWSFDSTDDALLHTSLARLDEHMRSFLEEGGMRDTVERELAAARELEQRSLQDAAPAWQQACEEIAASPCYEGLRIRPQLGLVPLGPDPATGLWEFWHVLSGEAPVRDPSDRWRIEPETGVVLVLIPGGPYTIGAQSGSSGGENFDPAAGEIETPPVHLTLAPWFHSKYELTQGQWMRLKGRNPSLFRAGNHYSFYGTISRTHPVESVSWEMAVGIRLWGLELPTEAQWEAAARAGTATPFWFGPAFEGEAAAEVNHYDRSAEASQLQEVRALFEDGFPLHAPVDRNEANPFGIHGTLGNVSELCRGSFPDSYARVESWELDGKANTVSVTPFTHPLRGGAFTSVPSDIRVSRRSPVTAGFANDSIGIRPSRRLDP